MRVRKDLVRFCPYCGDAILTEGQRQEVACTHCYGELRYIVKIKPLDTTSTERVD